MDQKGKQDTKKVWLSIKGTMGSEDVMGQPAEFMTEGDLYTDSGTPCIAYQEYALSGMGNTRTTIRFEEDGVEVIRMGDINSLLQFHPGKHEAGMYVTPYGEFAIDTYTKTVDVDYDEEKSPRSVKVKYDLAVGNGRGENTLDIKIRTLSKDQEQ